MSRFNAYENLDRRRSQLSAHPKIVDTDSYKPCVIVSLSLIIRFGLHGAQKPMSTTVD